MRHRRRARRRRTSCRASKLSLAPATAALQASTSPAVSWYCATCMRRYSVGCSRRGCFVSASAAVTPSKNATARAHARLDAPRAAAKRHARAHSGRARGGLPPGASARLPQGAQRAGAESARASLQGPRRLGKALLRDGHRQLRQPQRVELVREAGHEAVVERQQHALLPQLRQRQAVLQRRRQLRAAAAQRAAGRRNRAPPAEQGRASGGARGDSLAPATRCAAAAGRAGVPGATACAGRGLPAAPRTAPAPDAWPAARPGTGAPCRPSWRCDWQQSAAAQSDPVPRQSRLRACAALTGRDAPRALPLSAAFSDRRPGTQREEARRWRQLLVACAERERDNFLQQVDNQQQCAAARIHCPVLVLCYGRASFTRA